MMITFTRTIPDGEDVDAAAKALVDTAKHWVLMAVLSGSFDPMPAVTIQRRDTIVFVETGEMILHGLEMVSALRTAPATLLEAKVEVED